MNREVHVRFWESVGVQSPALLNYLHAHETVREVKAALKIYFRFYNERRPHQCLDYRTPDETYCGNDIIVRAA